MEVFVQHFEFEQRRLLNQTLGTFRILDTGQLHNDLLQPLALNNRLRDTELIDAVPDGFQRLVDGGILDALVF